MLVYKYRGSAFDRDLESLQNNQFWASHTKQLNDPCEGLVGISSYEAELETLKSIFPQQAKHTVLLNQCFQNIIDMKDQKLGILSLSKNYNDELLWAHYADSHKGFCIEYDLDKLIKQHHQNHKYFEVNYIDNPPDISLSNILSKDDGNSLVRQMLGYKSKRWEYENEIRVITENYGLNIYDFRAVKSIYFGLRMSEHEILKVMKALKGRNVNYFKMSLKPNSFQLEAFKIKDQFPTLEKYKYSIAQVAELAVDPHSMKAGYKKFIPYLYKLSEIIRREPDCIEVSYIDLSYSKSTPTSPVFFAQYKTQENDWLTHTVHYTLEEIDSAYKKIDDPK
jgi:hypothetical protein